MPTDGHLLHRLVLAHASRSLGHHCQPSSHPPAQPAAGSPARSRPCCWWSPPPAGLRCQRAWWAQGAAGRQRRLGSTAGCSRPPTSVAAAGGPQGAPQSKGCAAGTLWVRTNLQGGRAGRVGREQGASHLWLPCSGGAAASRGGTAASREGCRLLWRDRRWSLPAPSMSHCRAVGRTAPAGAARLSRAPPPCSAALDAGCNVLRREITAVNARCKELLLAWLHLRAAPSAPTHERASPVTGGI